MSTRPSSGSGWQQVADQAADQDEYGQVPGRPYLMVGATIHRRGELWRVAVAQWEGVGGQDESLRIEVYAVGSDLDEAVREAKDHAEQAGCLMPIAIQALTRAWVQVYDELP